MDAKQQFVTPAEEQIVRYLLHEMKEGERSGLEERLAQEPAFFEVIAATEDDMIMRYVRGDLEPRLLPRFEAIYLRSPAQRRRVDQARIFQQAVRDAAPGGKSGPVARWFASPASRLRLVIYSAAVAAAILCAVLVPRWKDNSITGQPEQNTFPLRVSLEPGRVRGSTGVQINLPAATKQVQFQLTLPKEATEASYVAVLKNPEPGEIWHGLATSGGRQTSITVPADKLAAGDYTIELQVNGFGVADYYFRVVRTKP